MSEDNQVEQKEEWVMQIEEIQKHANANDIDWEMTPEDAVTRYLEWGTSWSRGRNMVRSKNDVSYYFTISTWHDPPKIHFMKINSEDAVELALIDIPKKLRDRFLETAPAGKGVFPLNAEIKAWLEEQLWKEN
jgi:hypothetical protein